MSHHWKGSHVEEPLTHIRLLFCKAMETLGLFTTTAIVLITVRHTQMGSRYIFIHKYMCVCVCLLAPLKKTHIF